jgi:tetratricopeptide (TPR) repeat protein
MSTPLARATRLHQEASTAHQQGNIDRAEVLYAESREIFLREGGEYFLEAANVMNALALLKEKHGDCDGALQVAKKAMQIMGQMSTSRNRKADEIRLQSWGIIGKIHRRLARYEEAEQVLQRALDHALNTFGAADEQTISIFNEFTLLYKQMGKLEKAEGF